MFSLNENLISKIIERTLPSFQNVDLNSLNLGFGYIFYSFTRTLRPQNIIVIGSKAGFSPVMFGLGMKDNEGTGVGKIRCYETNNIKDTVGKLYFIDPSYDIESNDDNHWFGIGYWTNPEQVKALWTEFGLEDVVSHFKMTSKEFVEDAACPSEIELIYIDGDHSYDGMMEDINQYYPKLKKDGMVILHDVDPRIKDLLENGGGNEVYETINLSRFEKIRLPVFPGIAILIKR
ncbi:class I SAM-dependent methyltransferase [Mucilaginibacter galii]|uniref:Class I SAM-dependent methyltransferase n=1 Tax=Mucilaginibacter galii TaxID=2005073 RepID=A0A917N352_9SPHI|nr:class I SAM-dependent methyltransferase [Mucilaginibacter galii]GGI52159.1 hypothetical protein GCM10011425_33710 [Mucilaginibacter galii]